MAGYYRRSEYTRTERENIIQYIITHKQYYGLKGRALWQQMENDKVCNRSWQSMKEHFRSKIIPEIKYFNISSTERRNILAGFNGKKIDEMRKPVNVAYIHSSDSDVDSDDQPIFSSSSAREIDLQASSQASAQKRGRLPELHSEHTFSSSSDEAITNNGLHKKKSGQQKKRRLSTSSNMSDHSMCLLEYRAESQQNKNLHLLQTKSNNNNSLLDNERHGIRGSDSDTTLILDRNASRQANSKADNYSSQDDEKILTYFNSHRAKLKLWKSLETYTLLKTCYSVRHTPTSIRNRFVTHILPNLYKYRYLSYDEMIDMYDITGYEIPEELQTLINETRNDANVEENITVVDSPKRVSNTETISTTLIINKDLNQNNNLVMSSDSEDSSDPDIYTRDNEPFSEREDYQIVEILKRYRKSLKSFNQKKIFKLMTYMFKRKQQVLEDRFYNDILLRISDFTNLTLGDMLEFYINAANRNRNVPNNIKEFLEKFCKSVQCEPKSGNTNTNEVGIQVTKDFYDLYKESYMCIQHNSTNYAFISDAAEEIDLIKTNIKEECSIPSSNIHVVGAEEFKLVKCLKQSELEFKTRLKHIVDNYLLENKRIDDRVYDEVRKNTQNVLSPLLSPCRKPTSPNVNNALSSNSECQVRISDVSCNSSNVSQKNEEILNATPTITISSSSATSTDKSDTAPTQTEPTQYYSFVNINPNIEPAEECAQSNESLISDTPTADPPSSSSLESASALPDATNKNRNEVSLSTKNYLSIGSVKAELSSEENVKSGNLFVTKFNISNCSTIFGTTTVNIEKWDEDDDVAASSFYMQNIMLSKKAKELMKQKQISVAHLQPQSFHFSDDK